MISPITEGSLTFTFQGNTPQSTKYDDWSFYRNQFNAAFGGTKAVDIIFVENKVCWLIEVKDYRTNARTKPIDLADEIALKVRDTLAGLLAASKKATGDEKVFANAVIKASEIKVVLHLEQPVHKTRIRPTVIDIASVTQKLKKLLKPIGRPHVVDKTTLTSKMHWKVI